MITLPHIDARSPEPPQRQAALLRFDDAAVMFTASWGTPSLPVPRRGGAYRRQYMVHLTVPNEHRSRMFHELRSVTLYGINDREPRVVDDFGGIHDVSAFGMTLALFADDVT